MPVDVWRLKPHVVPPAVVRAGGWCALVLVLVAGLWSTASLIAQSGAALAVANLGIDTSAYRELGLAVAQQGLSAIPPTHPPGYPVFLSLVVRASALLGTTHWIEGVKWIQLGLLVVVAVSAWRVGAALFSPLVGVLAAVCVVWSPGYRAYAATVQYEVLATAVAWGALALGVGPMTRRRALLLGIIVGCAALVRETDSFVALPLLVWWWGSHEESGRGRFAHFAICLLLGGGCVVGGWIVHQWWVYGVLVPISAKSAINFQIGFNPHANGTFNVVADGIGEPAGWGFITAHPGAAAGLVVRKLGYLWGFLRDGWNVPRPGTLLVWRLTFGMLEYTRCMTVAQVMPTLVALAGVVWGLQTRSSRRAVSGLLALLAASSAFYALFIGSYRFLLPVLPAVYLLLSLCVVRMGNLLGRRAALGGTVVVGALLLVSVSFCGTANLVLEIPASQLEGIDAMRLVTPDGVGLRAEVSSEPRVVALFPAEYLPSGVFSVRAAYDDSAVVGLQGEIVLRKLSGRAVCKVPLVERGSTGLLQPASPATMSRESPSVSKEMLCRMTSSEPVSIELRARGAGGLVIRRVTVHGVEEISQKG